MYLLNHIFKYFIFNVTTETYLKICMCLSFFSFMGFNLYEAFTMINMINLTILRNKEKAVLFGVFEVANTLLNVGMTLVLLLVYHYGWYARAGGIIFAYSVFFMISLIHMIKSDFILFRYDREEVRKALKISVPLIPHVVGAIIISLSDRFFIERMVSLEMVGIYSVGYMFGMIVALFTDSFIKAWSPWFYKTLSNGNSSKKLKIVKYSYYYILATFIIAFGISILAKFVIPYYLDVKYAAAGVYVFWIAIGYAVHGVYKIFFPYLVHISKTAFLGTSTLIAALLNLIFNYFFILKFGTIGAAYSTVLSFIVSAVLVFWYQNKHYKMPWFFFIANDN